VSAFGVFVVAKLIVLAAQDIAWSPWTGAAFFWQDTLVAAVIGVVEALARRRPSVVRAAYAASVLYVAANVPLTLVLSTPLTWRMALAARGALSDSIEHHLTWANAFAFGVVVLAGIVLPWLLTVLRLSILGPFASCAGATFLVLGPFASTRAETSGLHRNALVALVTSALPRVIASAHEQDWPVSPFDRASSQDFSHLQGTAAGRNAVVIALESTGASYLKCYGAQDDPMPNLTRVAERALLFENPYAVYPESIKGLFSVLCSRYPAFDTGPELHSRVRTPSLAHVLAQAGYRTALFHSGRFMYLGMDDIVRGRGFEILEDAGAIGGNVHSSFGVDEPATVERMLAWIDSVPRAQPFFLMYLPIAGHHPYNTPAPGPFPEADEAGAYRNALHYGDAALGELLDGLRRRGLDTNTLFIIYGDHGEAFGQHPGNYGHTFFIYEENVRVPLLIAAPGLLDRQVRVTRVASLLDLAPSVAGLLGVPAPAGWQGASLLDGAERMALFYTDYSLGLAGLRDGRWKFIHEFDTGRAKLFDLWADAGERVNLAGQHPERVRAYRQQLKRWSAAQKYLIARSGSADSAERPEARAASFAETESARGAPRPPRLRRDCPGRQVVRNQLEHSQRRIEQVNGTGEDGQDFQEAHRQSARAR
jgi:arylsulfatase A-like enzyme